MADTPAPAMGAEAERLPPAPPAPRTAPPRWTAGRIVMLVAGSVLALVSVCVLAVGAYGLWLDTTQRSDGYAMTSSERFSTGGYALATRTLHVGSEVPGFLYGRDWLGDVRIRGKSADPARSLFIGIARKDDIDRYLAGVAHSEVVDVEASPFDTGYRPSYRVEGGGRPAVGPRRTGFWVASVSGRGSQALTWSVRPGRWAVVVMRPDATRGVSADLAAGAKLPALLWVSIVLLAVGLLALCGAGALIYFGARERRPGAPAAGSRTT